jgi:NAD(P)-dependent dehydrogenase (short-subunit alcohol dehydrogenase family)
MAPEQAKGALPAIGERTDIFGLGALLYFILTGRPPFDGASESESLTRARAGLFVDPERTERGATAPALCRIVRKAMAPDPEDRHATVLELEEDVRGFLNVGLHFPSRAFPPGEVIVREGDPGDRYYAEDITEQRFQLNPGSTISVPSGAGLGVSLTGIQSYATAKAAQLGLVRQLAHELGPSGITVNAVAPGFLRTSPDYERQWQSYGPEGQKAMIERVAMRRLGEPQDIAHAVMFLASPYASWITGQVLPVTGSPLA